ncbi:hypothetical protein GcC1_c18476o16 [Golovinomyces cichoracearum]|uniref:Uncharacterized protein n=1 Tax=Golovinomyces cichoracearum TaxID=62708 RepID=A0A420IRK3_9PEZI|nr:hypothetical protein GcC1_c18476o16 [Golovinomyces cichoracearum]
MGRHCRRKHLWRFVTLSLLYNSCYLDSESIVEHGNPSSPCQAMHTVPIPFLL